MGQEIESKMRLRDREGLVTRLTALVGEPVAEFIETDVFVDTPDERLRRGDSGLRVRIQEDLRRPGQRQVVVTFKGSRTGGRWKSREEIEFQASDEVNAIAVFSRLGYEPGIRFQKRRVRWRIDGCHVEVDHLPYLGDFIEVEGPDDDAVARVLQQLGLAEEPMESRSYVAMLDEYFQRHGIAQRDIVLPDGG